MSISILVKQCLLFFVLLNHDSLFQNVIADIIESVLQLLDGFKYMIMLTKTMSATSCLQRLQYTNSTTINFIPGLFFCLLRLEITSRMSSAFIEVISLSKRSLYWRL